MHLSEMKKGDRGIIRHIGMLDAQIALMNMGLLPGDVFELTDMAGRGCPIAIKVNGTKIALRRAIAASIEVEPLLKMPAELKQSRHTKGRQSPAHV